MNFTSGLIFLVMSSVAVAADPASFTSYHNPRFNFEVTYPSFLIPQAEPTNGAGREFVKGDARLLVYGSFFPDLSSKEDNFAIADERALIKKDLQKKGVTIDYDFNKGNVLVLSGSDGKQIVYMKKIFVAHCGVHLYLWLYYPENEKKQWDNWVDTISPSFKYRTKACQGDYSRI